MAPRDNQAAASAAIAAASAVAAANATVLAAEIRAHIEEDRKSFSEQNNALKEINNDVKSLLASRNFAGGAWKAATVFGMILTAVITLWLGYHQSDLIGKQAAHESRLQQLEHPAGQNGQ